MLLNRDSTKPMSTLPHEYFISQLAYTIGYAENEFFLVPENTTPRYDYTKDLASNCKDELIWGSICTTNRINSGIGQISNIDLKINEFIQDISFEYQLGVYSRIKLEVWCFGASKPEIIYAYKIQYTSKFKEHTDVIKYIFGYLPEIVKCKTIDELRLIFPQEGNEI